MRINPIYLKDFYKVGHHLQYPKGTQLIFSNFTPRKSLVSGINHSVFFGLRYFIERYLKFEFDSLFFSNDYVAVQYGNLMYQALGDGFSKNNIESLRKLGYLPLEIYALPELSVVPCGVPALVIYNTLPEFYWLPNMLETLLSCSLWGMCTSATIARQYRLLLDKFAAETSDIPEFVDYQAHDFSFRGMNGVEAAAMSGMAHLQYFKGTDTIPALLWAAEYYGQQFGISSVAATEHSVMSAGGQETEYETYRRLIEDIYPDGILSIVSDTWDLWKVVGEILPKLKDKIMARDGKIVIRPDSGDPADILCGKSNSENPYETKGLIESLWDIFRGTINGKGYKQLDSHIGAIYGDSITIDRATIICEKLRDKGFASTNIVFGIGSYTYQYNTRDTFGWAIKSTYCEIDGKGYAITKDPITDNGTKKSHSGLLKVIKSNDTYQLLQNQSWEEFYQSDNELKMIFSDGKLNK